MIVPYKDSLGFEIYVMDLIESIKPKSASEMESISEELHQSIEIAISDSLEEYDFADEYEPNY